MISKKCSNGHQTKRRAAFRPRTNRVFHRRGAHRPLFEAPDPARVAGASADIRTTILRFTPEARRANQAMIDLLSSIAQRKKATPAQIALARLLTQKPWVVPIPGSQRLERLEENLGAEAVALKPDDLREIERATSQFTVQGTRYPESPERLIHRCKENDVRITMNAINTNAGLSEWLTGAAYVDTVAAP